MYARNERVVRAVIPLPFQFINPEEYQLQTVIYGIERLAGVEVRRPFGMLYIDGI